MTTTANITDRVASENPAPWRYNRGDNVIRDAAGEIVVAQVFSPDVAALIIAAVGAQLAVRRGQIGGSDAIAFTPDATLHQVVHEAVGAASVCWEGATLAEAGTFDERGARNVAAALLAEIATYHTPAIAGDLAAAGATVLEAHGTATRE